MGTAFWMREKVMAVSMPQSLRLATLGSSTNISTTGRLSKSSPPSGCSIQGSSERGNSIARPALVMSQVIIASVDARGK